MSMFHKVGNTIFNSNRLNKIHNYNKLKNRTLTHCKSEISVKSNINFFKPGSNFSNFKGLEKNKIKPFTKTINNQSLEINFTKTLNNNKSNRNTKTKFLDLKTNTHFFPFKTKDYINEANKIILYRYENKNIDLLSKNNNKMKYLSDTREISRNNQVIKAIKKNMMKIKLNCNGYQKSLIKSQSEIKNDIKKFREFIDYKNSKSKKENDLLLKIRVKHEEVLEKYEKEMQKYKKLNEELERKIKIIYMLKNYGSFIYKILGKTFWLEDLPDINQKNKNYDLISDLIIEKYKLLNSREQLNNEEYYFDDGILIIKFKDLEQKVLKSIDSNGLRIWEIKDKIHKEEFINKITTRIQKLTSKNDEMINSKNNLKKNLKKSQSIKFDNDTFDTFLDYIIQLGKETEKCNIDGSIYFPDLIEKERLNTSKENDFRFYTKKTLYNLKKKETLINKFIEYIDNIKNSEDRNIFLEIEQRRKNINKKEKLKLLKQKQELLHFEKNKKALERNTKFVVISKKVPQIYKFTKITKTKISALRKENKVKDDMELLYYDENI